LRAAQRRGNLFAVPPLRDCFAALAMTPEFGLCSGSLSVPTPELPPGITLSQCVSLADRFLKIPESLFPVGFQALDFDQKNIKEPLDRHDYYPAGLCSNSRRV